MKRPKNLFDTISLEAQMYMPVNYRWIQRMPTSGVATRLAESRYYHATGYVCRHFYKDISRFIKFKKPEQKVVLKYSFEKPAFQLSTERGVFRLFACCIPVRGARRSLICDLQRETFQFIPNGLHEILTECKNKSISDIKKSYNNEYDKEIDEYFQFLLEGEYGFWCCDTSRFPDMDLTYARPERITNAIIDVDDSSRLDFANIFQQLDELGCKALQIRFYSLCSIEGLRRILEKTRSGRLRSIELLIRHNNDICAKDLKQLCIENQRISKIFVHSSPENKVFSIENIGVSIYYYIDQVESPQNCGEVHPFYFSMNIESFTEAQRLNMCLNCKISIDSKGDVKNCPSCDKSFGNIMSTRLETILSDPNFKQLWLISKDQVEVCRDCEFRYICPDCRVYIHDHQNVHSKPSKCNYDPYTAQWK